MNKKIFLSFSLGAITLLPIIGTTSVIYNQPNTLQSKKIVYGDLRFLSQQVLSSELEKDKWIDFRTYNGYNISYNQDQIVRIYNPESSLNWTLKPDTKYNLNNWIEEIIFASKIIDQVDRLEEHKHVKHTIFEEMLPVTVMRQDFKEYDPVEFYSGIGIRKHDYGQSLWTGELNYAEILATSSEYVYNLTGDKISNPEINLKGYTFEPIAVIEDPPISDADIDININLYNKHGENFHHKNDINLFFGEAAREGESWFIPLKQLAIIGGIALGVAFGPQITAFIASGLETISAAGASAILAAAVNGTITGSLLAALGLGLGAALGVGAKVVADSLNQTISTISDALTFAAARDSLVITNDSLRKLLFDYGNSQLQSQVSTYVYDVWLKNPTPENHQKLREVNAKLRNDENYVEINQKLDCNTKIRVNTNLYGSGAPTSIFGNHSEMHMEGMTVVALTELEYDVITYDYLKLNDFHEANYSFEI